MKNGKPKNIRNKKRPPRPDRNGGGWDPKMYDIGLRAFERDLPELMKTHHRQWVVYHGERRIGPFKRLERLNKECEKLNLPIGEQICRVVEPDFIEDVVA